jgi:hypothetical protein
VPQRTLCRSAHCAAVNAFSARVLLEMISHCAVAVHCRQHRKSACDACSISWGDVPRWTIQAPSSLPVALQLVICQAIDVSVMTGRDDVLEAVAIDTNIDCLYLVVPQ